MTLREYLCTMRLHYPDFRDTHFAKKIGIVPSHLARIKARTHRPGYKLASRIQAETSGAVTILELLNIKGNEQQ